MPRRARNWGWAINLSRYTVILDANVLYSAPLRDLILELAVTGMFRAKWTDQIHDEWIGNLLENRPELNAEALLRTRELINASVMDSLVTGYEDLIETIRLPDANDRHVLAAAVRGHADAIVTYNLGDFPDVELARYEIEALHPDDFLHHQFGLDQSKVIIAAQQVRARLKNPPLDSQAYLDTLLRQSLPKFVAELDKFRAVI